MILSGLWVSHSIFFWPFLMLFAIVYDLCSWSRYSTDLYLVKSVASEVVLCYYGLTSFETGASHRI